MASSSETLDLHFALGHLDGATGFRLHAGGWTVELKEHTASTRALHAERNRALGLLDDAGRAQFTHYAEGVALPTRRAQILRVTYPSATRLTASGYPEAEELALMAIHVPTSAMAEHRRRCLQVTDGGVPVSLAALGVTKPITGEQAVEAAGHADRLVTTYSTAATVIFHHPQLATSDPTTAATVVDDHINSSDNLTNVQRFQAAIARQGTGWQASVPSTDIKGNNLTWGPSFGSRAGTTVYANQLSSTTLASAGGALGPPLTTSQQDATLQGACWSVNQGIGAVVQTGADAAQRLQAGRAAAKARMRAASGGYAFTLNNLTAGHGLSIDDGSLTFTPDPQTPGGGEVAINVSNSYLRSLYAYAQFLDDNGTVIPVTVDGQSEDYLPINVVTPVNVVLGIPMPTEPTELSFPWVPDAASARLVHGGLGTSRWDNAVVWPGAILTGIFNYAIPGLFLLVGAELDTNAWFKSMEEEKPLVATLLKLGLAIFGTEASASVAFPDVSAILSALADAIAGFLVHEGLEELQEYIIEKLTEAALEDAIPGVDIFFQIANRAVDLAEIAETTVEVLTSPAVYEVDIVRTLDLSATIGPDPTHGTSTNPAIWPVEAVSFEAIVQYRGGTAHTQSGPMPSINSSTPITVDFANLPAGGSLQVKFNVYAQDGFLAGQYTSAWQPAVLPDNAPVLTITGSIQENLVPLSPTTVYQYKEKLVFDAATSAHAWQPAQFTLPTREAAALDQGQVSTTARQVFAANACPLSSPSVDVLSPGMAWTVTDGGAVYRIAEQTIPVGGGKEQVLMVSTANAPVAVVTDLSADNQGHNLAKLVGVTMNNKAYMLGYCWEASGQGIPETGGSQPVYTQIHAFQNINVLANPEAALKFSPSGFVNQPALVYDQFGPSPLFSLPASDGPLLDPGGAVPPPVATAFAQAGYPLATEAVVTLVTAATAWNIGLPSAAPQFALARSTDTIGVSSYPPETVSQNNFYVEPTSDSPTSYQYQVRQVVLDDTTPFDMNQSRTYGLFTLPFNDDFAVHPQGYLIAISYSLSRMMILQLPEQPVAGADASSAVIVSGPAGNSERQGLMNGPVALSVTADGRILVLEQGTGAVPGQIQAFDVNGNPVPCFPGAAVTTLPASAASELDAGLVGLDIRAAFSAASSPLASLWLVRGQGAQYQLQGGDAGVVVTASGANLSLHWTIASAGTSYTLALTGGGITVSSGGKVIGTVASSLATRLNQGITSGAVAQALAAIGITLSAPVSITGDAFTLDDSVIADLVAGTVPPVLGTGLAARGLALPQGATVSGPVGVTVQQPGSLWTIQDARAAASYQVSSPGSGQPLQVHELVSGAPLNQADLPAPVTYTSMCTETKGYIYTLGYTGAGDQVADYLLDIYQPDGAWLARTSGVNAAKITLDMWRNLYTLNYEAFLGPTGRTEPSVSLWFPSA